MNRDLAPHDIASIVVGVGLEIGINFLGDLLKRNVDRTPFVLLPPSTEDSDGGGGGGGCSLSAYNENDPYSYFVPYVILAVAMGILRLRGLSRRSISHGYRRLGRT